MNGREKMLAAISKDGAPEMPVTIAYDVIYYRDHVAPLCVLPWSDIYAQDPDKRAARFSEEVGTLGFDSMFIRNYSLPRETDSVSISVRDGKVWQYDRIAGTETEIPEPKVGSDHTPIPFQNEWLEDPEDVDRLLDPEIEKLRQIIAHDFVDRTATLKLVNKHRDRLPYAIVFVPFVKFLLLFGVANGFVMTQEDPKLVQRFCEKYLHGITMNEIRNAASFGAAYIQMDLGFMDMIAPEIYKTMVEPSIRQMMDEIRGLGMYCHLNYLGDSGRILDDILALDADLYRFEDAKSGFLNDIGEIIDRAPGRFALEGNLNAITILQDGTDEQLEAEVKHMMQLGQMNKGRFIMCTGSSVTPFTPLERIERYLDLSCKYAAK